MECIVINCLFCLFEAKPKETNKQNKLQEKYIAF